MSDYVLGNQIRAGGGARGANLSKIRDQIPRHHEGLEVKDLDPEGLGTFPRPIEVQTNDADGAKLLALWHGDFVLLVGDFVRCREDPSSPILIIEGFGQGTSKGLGGGTWPRANKVTISDTNYDTFTAAVSAASAGDLIKVGEGSYTSNNESVSSIDIIGTGRQPSELTTTTTSPVLSVTANDALIKDLYINQARNATSINGVVVTGGGGVPIFENVTSDITINTSIFNKPWVINDNATLINCNGIAPSGADALQAALGSGEVLTVRGGYYEGDFDCGSGGTVYLQGPTITGDVSGNGAPILGWWHDGDGKIYSRSTVHQEFLDTPGLRGYWPGSAVGPGSGLNSAGGLMDQSGLQNHLTANNTPVFTRDSSGLYTYVDYDGSNQYHNISDANSNNAFDILGTESYIASGDRGLTLGCWVNPDSVGAGLFGIMSKYLGSQISFLIYRSTATPTFVISNTGSTLAGTVSSGVSLSTGNWYFIVGRFEPSTETAIFVNGTKNTNTTSIPASIFNSSTDFEIGRYNGGNYFDGKITHAFVSTMHLPDADIDALFNQTRLLFGV